MTREETLAWAKSLKPGDKVIFIGRNSELSVLEVERVTPTGQVKTTNGLTFAQKSYWNDLYSRGSDSSGKIVPLTEDLLREVKTQYAKRQEEHCRQKIIRKAQSVICGEYGHMYYMSYEKAVKIIAAFEEIKACPSSGNVSCRYAHLHSLVRSLRAKEEGGGMIDLPTTLDEFAAYQERLIRRRLSAAEREATAEWLSIFNDVCTGELDGAVAVEKVNCLISWTTNANVLRFLRAARKWILFARKEAAL